MQKLLINVSHQDQVYVEDICTKKGYTLSGFFEMLLNEYRSTENLKLSKEREGLDKDRKALEVEREALKQEKKDLENETKKKPRKIKE
jgi:hypothetical protein